MPDAHEKRPPPVSGVLTVLRETAETLESMGHRAKASACRDGVAVIERLAALAGPQHETWNGGVRTEPLVRDEAGPALQRAAEKLRQVPRPGVPRQTHTYAEMAVSPAAYAEVAGLLEAAGYQHAFMDDGAIDMHGLALVREPARRCTCESDQLACPVHGR